MGFRAIFWPEMSKEDLAGSLQRRIVSFVCILVGLVGIVAGLLTAHSTFAVAPFATILSFVLPILFLGLTWLRMLSVPENTIGHILCMMLWFHLTQLTVLSDGVMFTSTFYLVSVPLIARVMFPAKTSAIYVLLVCFTYIALSGWALSGYVALALSILTIGLSMLLSFVLDTLNTMASELTALRDRAVASDKAKSDFLANVSHEIRTPLNGMIGMVQVLARADLDENSRHAVRLMESASDKLLELINDVLDLTKIESGEIEFEHIDFCMPDVITAVMDTMQYRAEAKGLAFTSELDDTAKCGLRSDPTRIKQVLLNFVSNAIKFTNDGSVHIAVTGEKVGNQIELTFTVTDTGPGMTQEQADRIFLPYMQADASINRTHGGTGLGLAICKRIVEGLGGNIWVETEAGKGSQFKFTLTAKSVCCSDTIRAKQAPSDALGRLSGLRVLAAEDQEINRMVLETLLQPHVAALHFAHNGKEAVEAVKQGAFDLVLMDIQMPVEDGLQATKRIRSFEQATGREPIPIIALTANAFGEQAEAYLVTGMNAVVTKPVMLHELARQISICIEEQSAAA